MSAGKALGLADLKTEAGVFLRQFSTASVGGLFGVTDGKAVGTYIEHEFHNHLSAKYTYGRGSSASGIDFPGLGVDVKATSIRQPQSSCPFRDAAQKVYGLGYDLLVFIYEKTDDPSTRTARFAFPHAIFVSHEKTADHQTSYGIREILRRRGNRDDLVAFLEERSLPLDDIGREKLAERILREPPEQGYLTVSNALQWRLQYSRVINIAKSGVAGVEDLAP